MTGMEPGWYRDPAPPNPAYPTTLRYWDGQGWTGQVKAASKREREAWHRELAETRARQAAEQWERAVATGTVPPQQLAAVAEASQRFATPDGQLLSGWWRRVGAVLLDGVVTGILGLLVGFPWVRQVGHAYSEFFTLLADSARSGSAMPDTTAFEGSIAGPLLTLGLVMLAVQMVYNIGFLKAFAATPGKMALGIEVRLREQPGVLSWGTVLTRWFGQYVGTLVGIIPVVGLLGVALHAARLPVAAVGRQAAGAARQARPHERGPPHPLRAHPSRDRNRSRSTTTRVTSP
ncbi:MAG: RDD family protein [Nocardioidaceae bacterium]